MELFSWNKVSKYHFQPLISAYVSERERVAWMILFRYPYKEVSWKYHGSIIRPCSHCIPFLRFRSVNVLGTFRAVSVPTWGNVLAQHGQRACPTWARCLPISWRIIPDSNESCYFKALCRNEQKNMTEQYLCSPVVIYTNEYGILELQVINAENRLLLQEMQAQKFLPCPNNPPNVHYTVLA